MARRMGMGRRAIEASAGATVNLLARARGGLVAGGPALVPDADRNVVLEGLELPARAALGKRVGLVPGAGHPRARGRVGFAAELSAPAARGSDFDLVHATGREYRRGDEDEGESHDESVAQAPFGPAVHVTSRQLEGRTMAADEFDDDDAEAFVRARHAEEVEVESVMREQFGESAFLVTVDHGYEINVTLGKGATPREALRAALAAEQR